MCPVHRESTVSASTNHQKKQAVQTPKLNFARIQIMPEISVREWQTHTSHMLIFDWFPLTYFAMSTVLSPNDHHGCKAYALRNTENLLYFVYGPVLFLRFLGAVFMNRQKLIIYQIFFIYSYLVIALTTWEIEAVSGMKQLSNQCYHPLKMSMLNLMIMTMFYLFVLCPYITVILMLPYYFYLVYKQANRVRQRILAKHYLIKAMPSFVFDKKMFERGAILECAICIEPFNEGQDYVTPLYCDERHCFHSDCIEEWLEKENVCPLCKVQQTPKRMRTFSERMSEKTLNLTIQN